MISRYGARAIIRKLLIYLNLINNNLINIYMNLYQTFAGGGGGGIWVLHYLLLHERQTNEYIFVSDHPVPSMWYPLLGQSVFS